MAKGNEIIVTSNPRGCFKEGIIDGALKPGTMMQLKASTAAVGGRFTWQRYQRGTDGVRSLVAILLPDHLQGKTATEAYVDGDRCFIYCPLAGEEMNILIDDIAGTADDWAIGDIVIADTETGRFIATTGTPESEPFELLEAVVDPAADHLAYAQATGQ